ncbi:MAG TPA: metallophosphoesterase [Chitinispirillaceae bacterium]|nr:metallophosphoesterase [Chitinispirillaceae bacterium]
MKKRNYLKAFYCLIMICFNYGLYAESKEFYFVQITDTHWGEGDNLERTKDVIKKINDLNIPIEFVVHTGDMADYRKQSAVDSGLTLMKKLKFPVYYVPGNNDICNFNFNKSSEIFAGNFGAINRIDNKKISIITTFNIEVKDLTGKIIYDPLLKLDSLLQSKPKTLPAILFQHCPVSEDFYKNDFHAGWSAEKKDSLVKLCENNNVAAIICGHFHRGEFHMIGNIPLYVAAPVSGGWGRQASFRIYHYLNGKLSYFTSFL